MAYKRMTFLDKYQRRPDPEIKETDEGMMVIPSTPEIDGLMEKVPEGKVVTQTEIREYLAKKHKVDFCCPLVTGIFVNIIAGKAEEDMATRDMAIDEITPYWRTLKKDGELNPKYPDGVETQAAKLRKEGHEIELSKIGKPRKVADYRDKLYKFS